MPDYSVAVVLPWLYWSTWSLRDKCVFENMGGKEEENRHAMSSVFGVRFVWGWTGWSELINCLPEPTSYEVFFLSEDIREK